MTKPVILETDATGKGGRMMRSLENRIPPPLLMLVIGVAMAASMLGPAPAALPASRKWVVVVGLFAAAGLFGFPAFAAFVKAKTTIDPVQVDRASTLVTTGIYRITRNPMYVALALLLARPWPMLGPIAFVLFINRFQIVPEERALTAKFDASYADYRGSVRRWL
jgi:protein-S-isoprenylcysteine O-methyltransferase Ste14